MQAARYRGHQLQRDKSCRYRSGCLLILLQGELDVGGLERTCLCIWVWMSGSLRWSYEYMRTLTKLLLALLFSPQAPRSFLELIFLSLAKFRLARLPCLFATVNRYCFYINKMKVTNILPVAALFAAVSSEPIPGMSTGE